MSGSYKVGDGVIIKFDRGNAVLYSNGGTLWPDWLERADINRNDVISIRVAEGIVYLPEEAKGYDERTEENKMFGKLVNVEEIDLNGFDTSKVQNMAYMFAGCVSLRQLKGADANINTSGVTNMQGMFGECCSLTDLDLGGFDTSNVTDMSFMFDNCKKLEKLDIRNLDTLSVTDLCGMFLGCDRLTDLDLSNFDMSKIMSTQNMFDGCRELKYIRMNPVMRENTQTENMFLHCPAEVIWTDE